MDRRSFLAALIAAPAFGYIARAGIAQDSLHVDESDSGDVHVSFSLPHDRAEEFMRVALDSMLKTNSRPVFGFERNELILIDIRGDRVFDDLWTISMTLRPINKSHRRYYRSANFAAITDMQ